MKRYLAFGGDQYYPGGGWDDFVGDFDSKGEAIEAAKKGNGWWHVIDRDTKKQADETILEIDQ